MRLGWVAFHTWLVLANIWARVINLCFGTVWKNDSNAGFGFNQRNIRPVQWGRLKLLEVATCCSYSVGKKVKAGYSYFNQLQTYLIQKNYFILSCRFFRNCILVAFMLCRDLEYFFFNIYSIQFTFILFSFSNAPWDRCRLPMNLTETLWNLLGARTFQIGTHLNTWDNLLNPQLTSLNSAEAP